MARFCVIPVVAGIRAQLATVLPPPGVNRKDPRRGIARCRLLLLPGQALASAGLPIPGHRRQPFGQTRLLGGLGKLRLDPRDLSTNHRKEVSPQAPLLAFGDPLYEAAPAPRTVALNVRGAYEERGGGFQRLAYSAREVEKIAGVYGITVPSDAVNLEENATEKRLREMDLTRYRILHFATHAIVGDEVKWITQPALVLSLAGTDDTYDGFLQTS